MDGFDQLPDALILQIFNSVSDIKTLIRCRAVSRRFNSLAPQTDSLQLRVDRVISSDSGCGGGDDDEDDAASSSDSLLLVFFKSIIKSLHELVSPSPLPALRQSHSNSPCRILRGFDRVRDLEIELPSGDLRLEKGAVVKWRAEFGRSLRSCAILGFRAIRYSAPPQLPVAGAEPGDVLGEAADFARGLKSRVVWTISALIAASARHYLLKEVVREQRELERLVLRDRDGEGTVVMDKAGMSELRAAAAAHVSQEEEDDEDEDGGEGSRNRTRVPNVRMRMRHAPRLELNDGVWAEGATLVVVRPSMGDRDGDESSGTQLGRAGGRDDVAEELREDAELATAAFGEGLYGEAVQALLKGRSYILEMNSF
ncbi:F-box domain containing protein [Parasponia andersonii]|uniref:F-box domain containing protein n=1 Tax=Parasponia andersonii TaxID=3476 RepID=A0A2P5CKM7_PARAD|nr:F-box domain containing protein [Parasponia andersonii]